MELIAHSRLIELLRYEPETGKFFWLTARHNVVIGSEAGSLWKKQNRWYIKVDFRTYARSRLAWFYMTKIWPEKLIDHENRNSRDDRWENLRPATFSQNAHNSKTHCDNTSGVRGVSWNKKDKHWIASVGHDYLGSFKTFEEAAKVATDARKRLFGEFYANV
jgi:hypothetical protein